MPFTQIIAFKSYLNNLGKPLNSTLNMTAFNGIMISHEEDRNVEIDLFEVAAGVRYTT